MRTVRTAIAGYMLTTIGLAGVIGTIFALIRDQVVPQYTDSDSTLFIRSMSQKKLKLFSSDSLTE